MNVATVVGVASAVISVASAIFAAWQVKLARVQAVSARSQAASAERQAREAESQTALMSESLKAETTAREAAEANRRMTLIVEFLLSARNLYETLDRYSSGAKITLAAGLAGSVLRTDFSARERLNDELDAGRDAYTRAKDALAPLPLTPEESAMISRLDDDLAFVSLWKSKRTKARLDTARRTLAELWEFFEMPAAYAPRTG